MSNQLQVASGANILGGLTVTGGINADQVSVNGTPVTSGAVSSVNGTSGRTAVSPTTGATVVDLVTTAVTPGSYTSGNFTVDAYGRLTAAANGSSSSGPSFETGTIDLTVVQNVTLVPSVAGKKWRTDFLRIRVITNGPSLSVAAAINVGITSTAFNDMVNGFGVGGVLPADSTYYVLVSGSVAYKTMNVTSLPIVLRVATAGAGDVLTASFQIWGEYV